MLVYDRHRIRRRNIAEQRNWYEEFVAGVRDMAELNRRTTVVNAIRRISTVILADGYAGDEFALGQELQALQTHYERFVQINDVLIGTAEEAELATHETLAAEIETTYNSSIAKLRRLLAAQEALAEGAERSLDIRSHPQNDLRLDPLTVPVFDGSLANWLAFKDTFETLVHDHEYPEAYKLAKLRCAAKSVALVGGTYSGGYEEVWKALKKRYDNPKQLADIHIAQLVNLNRATQESADQLLAIVDSVRATMRALQVMKQPVEHWDAIVVYLVHEKLPPITREAWGMTTTTDIPALEVLLTFLETRAHSIGNVIPVEAMPNNANRRQQANQMAGGSRLIKTNLATPAKGHCELCGENHRIQNCPVLLALPPGDRFGKLRNSNLCFNCLRPGHSTATCPSGGCRNCQKKHNTLLCRMTGTTPTNSNNVQPAVTPTANAVPNQQATPSSTAPAPPQVFK